MSSLISNNLCFQNAGGLSKYCSTKHSPRPKAANVSHSRFHINRQLHSIAKQLLKPRPPPPYAAFIAIGRPYCFCKIYGFFELIEVVVQYHEPKVHLPTVQFTRCILSPSLWIVSRDCPIQIQSRIHHSLGVKFVLG